jgi:hypothetical protein
MSDNPLDSLPPPNPLDALPPPAAAPAAAPYSFGQFLKEAGSELIRAPVKAISGIPLMAMDTGVGIRNLVTNISEGHYPKLNDFNPFPNTGPKSPTPYEMPSTTFNRTLDQYTVAPTGFLGKGSEFVSTAMLGSQLPAPQGVGTVQGAVKSTFGGTSEASGLAPANFAPAADMLKRQVLEKSQNAGYVVPPSTGNPSFMNRLLEGVSGKLKLQQEAALRNQAVTNELSATGIGQAAGSPITQGALSAIRDEAAQKGYEPIKGIGQIIADAQYGKDLDSLNQAAQGAAKSFPGINPSNDIDNIVAALKQPAFDSKDAVDAIRFLRSQADDAFRSGSASQGQAYKGAAQAIEDQIERHLVNQGDSGSAMLAAFRNARTQMAQTYTAGRALVGETGDFNARAYASELARNKPLIGDQRTIGQFATAFPKAARLTQESYPSISPLDAYGSAIASAASGSAAPLMIPLTRIGIREYLLSGAGQARALPPMTGAAPQTLGGLGSLVPAYFAQ